jgi:hypothetical protein
MTQLRLWTALFVLTAASAEAVVIDNFEQGPFAITGDAALIGLGVQTSLAPENAIDDTREVTVQSGAIGQDAGAVLALTGGDDALEIGFPASGGTVSLIYRPEATDLTDGGSSDRIVVEINSVASGGSIVLILDDAGGGSSSIGPPISGAGSLVIPFSDMPGVDPTQVDFVRVIFSHPGLGGWEVADIRSSGPPPVVPALSPPFTIAVAALLVVAALVARYRSSQGAH